MFKSISFDVEKLTVYTFYIYSFCLLTSLSGLEIISTLVGITALIYCLIYKSKTKDFIQINDFLSTKTMFIGLLFFLATAISAFMSPIKELAFDSIGSNRNIFLLLFLAFFWQKPFYDLRKFFIPVALFSGIFVSIYCIYQFFTGIDLLRSKTLPVLGSFYRSGGFFWLSLTLAYCCGMQFFLLLPYQLTKSFKKETQTFKYIYYIYLLLLTITIVTTGVRGSWLAFTIAFALFILTLDSRKMKRILAGIGVFALMAAMSLPSLRDRILSIGNMENISNVGRLTIWKSSLLLWLENPVFGVGLNASDYLVGDIYDRYSMKIPDLGINHHAHNDFLQVLVGTGVVGFLLFTGFLLSFLWMSYGHYKTLKRKGDENFTVFLGTFLALIFFCIGSMTQCNYTDREVNHSLTFILCIVLVHSLRIHKKMKS